MLALSIHSSSESVSIAVSKEKRIIKYLEEETTSLNKSNILLTYIKRILADYKIDMFKYIIFSRGPGGFTSIRSMISIAQGLCLVSKARILTVNTFQVFLSKLTPSKKLVVAFYKDSRKDYYFQFFLYCFQEKVWVCSSKILSGFQIDIEIELTKIAKLEKFDSIIFISDKKENNFNKKKKNKFIQIPVNASNIANSFFMNFATNNIKPLYHHPHYGKKINN